MRPINSLREVLVDPKSPATLTLTKYFWSGEERMKDMEQRSSLQLSELIIL